MSATKIADKVRDHPTVGILRCDTCGLVYLDSFDHVPEALSPLPTPREAWEDVRRQSFPDDRRRAEQLAPVVVNRRVLDVGCATGGGALLYLRELCRSVSALRPQPYWHEHFEDRGITVYDSLAVTPAGAFDVVASAHVFEHVRDPLTFVAALAELLVEGGYFIVEVPSADDALLRLYGSRAFAEFSYTRHHAFLYNATTLGMLLKRAGLFLQGVRQIQRYPLSNHLMWLARNRPGGHVDWCFLDSPELEASYAAALGKVGACDTIVAYATKGPATSTVSAVLQSIAVHESGSADR